MFASVFFILHLTLRVHAQSIELNPIVVTATRQAQRANESIASITVIEREELDQFGANTLGEIISRNAGVEFSRQGASGSAETVFIRGANGGHTLVLIDGVRFGSVSLGTSALEAIPMEQIKRIEILRGPGSALYGSDAIGGVINVITKNIADGASPSTGAMAGVGTQGTYVTHASLAQKNGATSLGLNVGVSGSDGINSLTTQTNPAFNADRDGYYNKNFGLKIEHALENNLLIGAGVLDSRNKNRYDAYQYDALFNKVNASLDYQRNHHVTESNVYTKFSPSANWSSTLRLSNGTDTDAQPSSTKDAANDSYKTTQRQYMWQNDVKLALGQALLLLERVEQKLDSNQSYTLNERSVNSYAAGWNGRWGSNNFQFNLRQDRNSQYGNKNSEFIGYGYQFTTSWNMAASYGTAFKAPTFNDLFYPVTPGVGGGNANLKPEDATNREVSLRYDTDKVQGHLTYFDNKIKNLIQWADDGTGAWYPTNLASASIKGEELGVSVQVHAWKYKVDLTLQDPKDDSNGLQLVSRAKRYATLGSVYSQAEYKLGVDLKAVGSRYYDPTTPTLMGGYSVFNLFGEYKIAKNWKAFARLDNVLDRSYELAHVSTSPAAVYGVPGRSAFVGIRYAAN